MDPDRTRMDLHPMDEPDPLAPIVQEEEVADPVSELASEPLTQQRLRAREEPPLVRRIRVVRKVCAVINIVCGLFAVVLGLHVLLVLANANPRNGFASLIDSWAAAISLGLGGLFTPDSPKLAVLLNHGLAALGWLLIAAVLTYAIRQFALPEPRTAVPYRRTVR